MLKLCILGSTGSVGVNTLAVAAAHSDTYLIHTLTGFKNWRLMAEQCRQYRPRHVIMVDRDAAQQLSIVLKEQGLTTIEVSAGEAAVVAAAGGTDTQLVMAAIVGGAGLLPTMAAIEAGKRVLLANKEALVMSGELFMRAVKQHQAELFPVDSEHNAIFQCLPAELQQPLGQQPLAHAGIEKILLTGSGGPFLTTPLAQLTTKTPAQACAHPNWSMGQKISVDSATMVNKGLEYTEARWLFACQPGELEILIHPQSIIHSMVQYSDGSVLAQLGPADMRTPIASCLAYPERIASGVEALDFLKLKELTFCAVEEARYPALKLAIDACWEGQWATTTLNAANECAVAAFLAGKIDFTAIASVIAATLDAMPTQSLNSIEQVLSLDAQARAFAQQWLQERLC